MEQAVKLKKWLIMGRMVKDCFKDGVPIFGRDGNPAMQIHYYPLEEEREMQDPFYTKHCKFEELSKKEQTYIKAQKLFERLNAS